MKNVEHSFLRSLSQAKQHTSSNHKDKPKISCSLRAQEGNHKQSNTRTCM